MSTLTNQFACDRCGTLDTIHATLQTQQGQGYLCHRCKTGEWHGYFDEVKEDDDPDHGPLMNRPFGDSDDQPSFG